MWHKHVISELLIEASVARETNANVNNTWTASVALASLLPFQVPSGRKPSSQVKVQSIQCILYGEFIASHP
jgi:hypothetical protein